MAKSPKNHTEFARKVAETFDRIGFDLVATLRDRFDEPVAQSVLARVRFSLLDYVTRAEIDTTPTLTPDLFGPTRRRSRKGGARG